MHVLIECGSVIPAVKYGGTERVVWWLGKALVEQGHKVTYLAMPGSSCPFADVIALDPARPRHEQIPDDVDIVHYNGGHDTLCPKPYLETIHGNVPPGHTFHINTVFISQNQAERCGGDYYIHHGLDLEEYGDPALQAPRQNLVFLAKAAWRVKNVKGAIRMTRNAGAAIEVAGGSRLNIKMGFRFTATPKARFHGMVDQQYKMQLLRRTEGLVFPVLWHEPFGLAVIEAMYYGNPAFVTAWGSLPELVTPEVGFSSNSESELTEAIKNRGAYKRDVVHEYIRENFNNHRMASHYVQAYEKVLNGETLNSQVPVKPDTPEPKRFSMTP